MGRGKRMVGGHPLLLAFVPLEHGKIRDPQEAVIFRRVSSLLEDAMAIRILLRQCQPQ